MVRAEIIYLWLSVDRKSSYSRAMDYPKIVTSTAVKWQMRRTQYVFWGKAVSSRTRQGQPGMCYERVLLIMISSGLNNYGYAWEMMAHFSKKSGHKDSGVLAWGQKWALVVTITNDDNADRLALLLSLSNRQRLRNSKGGQFDKDLINWSSHDPNVGAIRPSHHHH